MEKHRKHNTKLKWWATRTPSTTREKSV